VFFAAAYAIYTVARWVFVGDLAEAREHARWIVELEHTTGVAIEQRFSMPSIRTSRAGC
jgi:hypothetical protein